jgi:hypothetical protein
MHAEQSAQDIHACDTCSVNSAYPGYELQRGSKDVGCAVRHTDRMKEADDVRPDAPRRCVCSKLLARSRHELLWQRVAIQGELQECTCKGSTLGVRPAVRTAGRKVPDSQTACP